MSAAHFSIEHLLSVKAHSVDVALAWLGLAAPQTPDSASVGMPLTRRAFFRCMLQHSLPIPLDLLGIRTALLIDDEPAVLRSMARVLRQAVPDLTLYLADGPADGLTQVNDLKPDAVIVDAYMPTASGVQVCSAIYGASATRHIPVLGMTADPSPELSAAFERAGAVAFLEKPVDAPALFEALSVHFVPNTAGDYWS